MSAPDAHPAGFSGTVAAVHPQTPPGETIYTVRHDDSFVERDFAESQLYAKPPQQEIDGRY